VSYRIALVEEAHTVVETQIKPRVVEMTNCVLGEQSKKKFYVSGSVHHKSILKVNQEDATVRSQFILLQDHSMCFGCRPHPSSGLHKTVTTASGTGHMNCAATFLQRGQGHFGD
jgi:hypothetical protein